MNTSPERTDTAAAMPATYRRAVGLFADWCTATGHTAIPADPDTITAFLAAAAGPPATRAVQTAAIDAAHRAAGHPPPTRPAIPHPRPARPDITQTLQVLPQWGWPAALFARRDALLLTLWAAGATPTHLATLIGQDITVTLDRTLAVQGLGQLATTGDPELCPACVWLRWRPIQRRIASGVIARDLKRLLGTRGDDQPRRDQTHRCLGLLLAELPARAQKAPLFPALDQWGNWPLPTITATTGRGLRGVIAAHRDHCPAGRAATITAPPPPAPTEPAAPPPPPLDPATHARGAAARTAAIADLKAVSAQLADVTERADDLTARIAALVEFGGA